MFDCFSAAWNVAATVKSMAVSDHLAHFAMSYEHGPTNSW